MPLIDLNTNLKSLTYGEFGSTEPLVVKDINANPSPNGIELEGSKRIDDLKRISKLLTQTPAALKFASNQAALGIIEKGIQNPDAGFGKKLLGGVVGTATKLASTLAQVPVSGTGLHFVEGFAGKRGYLPGVRGHIEYKNKVPNGLYNKGTNNITTKGKLENKDDTALRGKILTTYVDKFEDSAADGIKLKDLYNPATTAPTIISKTDRNKPEQLNKNKIGSEYTVLYVSAENRSHGYEQANFGFDRNKYSVNLKSKLLRDKDSKDTTIEVIDRINGLGPIIGDLSKGTTIIDPNDFENQYYKDLIDFNFKVITPRRGKEDNSEVTYLPFRAFIDSFSDSFTGNWNDHNYVGRAETFYSYGGFNRSIECSFKIAANTKEEILPLYQKLNLLAGTTAPTYVGGGYMRGQIVSLTIGDYLSDATGIITSVSLTWNPDYIWHTEGMDEKNATIGTSEGQTETKKLPTVLDVSISFTPIHQDTPRYGNEFIGKQNTIFKAEF